MEPLLFELLALMDQKEFKGYDNLYYDLVAAGRENLINVELKLNEFNSILSGLNRKFENCIDCYIKYSNELKLIKFLNPNESSKDDSCLMGFQTQGKCLHDILNSVQEKN